MDKFQFLTIGNITIDTFLKIPPEAIDWQKTSKNEEKICFNFGEKIKVEARIETVGGNAANVAVAGAKMGLETAIWSVVGKDNGGRLAIDALKKQNVNVSHIHINKTGTTDSSVIISLKDDRTIFVYHTPHQFKMGDLPKSQWVYISTISKIWQDVYPKVIRWIKENDVKVIYQPGPEQRLLGINKNRELLEHAELIIMNKEEAMEFVENSKQIPNLLKSLLKLGPKIAVITDGENGSYAMDSKYYYSAGVEDVPIVEKTGAGDAYSSAFACALVYGKSIEEAMRWGILNSQSVIQKTGAQEGILTLSQIQNQIEQGRPSVEIKAEPI